MIGATISRPNPAPTCERCDRPAVGAWYPHRSDDAGPRCPAHMSVDLDGTEAYWCPYAPAEPASAGPAQQPTLAGEVQARLIEEARNMGYDEGFRSGREQGQRDERAHSIKVIAGLRDHMRRMALKTSADAEKYEALAREAREIERSYLAAANGLVDAGTRLGDGEAT